jgi:hypothetical protein
MFGPYSVELAEDVRDLDREAIEVASAEGAPVSAEALKRVQGLLEPPEGVELVQEDWLRLVACVDFVERRVPGATENGGTPVFITRNFEPEVIVHARDRVRELLEH